MTKTIETFWWIIEKLDWAGAIRSGDRRPCDTCGKRLAELLTDPDDQDWFQDTYRQVSRKLHASIEAWEDKTGTSCGLGDDSFSDLVAMIVGLGQSVYDQTLSDPTLALKRARARYGTIEGYKESFAYTLHVLPTERREARLKLVLEQIQKLQIEKAAIDTKIKALYENL